MDKIAQEFGLKPLHEAKQELLTVDAETGEIIEDLTPVEDEYDIKFKEDFNEVRDNIRTAIEDAKAVFDTARNVALSSQDTKSIEAFSKMMDTFVKSNKTMIEMHRDASGLKPPPEVIPQQVTNNTTNVLFSGSTADLFRVLKEKGVTALPSNVIDQD